MYNGGWLDFMTRKTRVHLVISFVSVTEGRAYCPSKKRAVWVAVRAFSRHPWTSGSSHQCKDVVTEAERSIENVLVKLGAEKCLCTSSSQSSNLNSCCTFHSVGEPAPNKIIVASATTTIFSTSGSVKLRQSLAAKRYMYLATGVQLYNSVKTKLKPVILSLH